MGSVQTNIVNRAPGRSAWQPTLFVPGGMVHYARARFPPQGVQPAYMSVNFYDGDYARQSEVRSYRFGNVREDLMVEMTAMLHESNSYVRTFQSMREWVSQEGAQVQPYEFVIHADRPPADEHVGKYNAPRTSEVAANIPGEESGMIKRRRDIVLRRRGTLNNPDTRSWIRSR